MRSILHDKFTFERFKQIADVMQCDLFTKDPQAIAALKLIDGYRYGARNEQKNEETRIKICRILGLEQTYLLGHFKESD